jgi:complement component 1 Q subcomponent-binding protein
MAPLAETAMSNSSQQFSFVGPSSSTIRHFSKESQTNLVDILAREEQEEVDSGNSEMPEELANLKSKLENVWRIVDDGATTQLFLKEKKVQISFHCQDTVEEEIAFDEDDDDDDEPMAPVRFTVTLSKAGKTLVISCLSEFGMAKIDSMASTTSSPDLVHANQGVLEKREYQGPDFLELAEDLQDAVAVFLEDECDVSSDVATFVAMYSDYKEQMQYAQFLKDAQSIIS